MSFKILTCNDEQGGQATALVELQLARSLEMHIMRPPSLSL